MFSELFEKLAHLPVNTIASDVASAFLNKNIPIVTSETGSGKTMLIPAACAALLAERHEDDIVYVLEPSRYLVTNAAKNLRTLLGKEKQDLVGYVMSKRTGEEVQVGNHETKIVFATVGWALKAGVVATAKYVILDEVHDTSIDLSIAKAILHLRLQKEEDVNVALLSATVDYEEQVEYWGDRCQKFYTEGSAFPVEYRHVVPDTDYDEVNSLWNTIYSLIEEKIKTDDDRLGLLVFVPGVPDIEALMEKFFEEIDLASEGSVFELQSAIKQRELLSKIEIAGVHGKSNDEERDFASAEPTKQVKILIGTNVMESGVSLTWSNAGISTGTGNVAHVVNSVKRLIREDLPAWRIAQQMGRVNRFGPGTFILHAKKDISERPNQAVPEIARISPHDLVLYLASEQLSPVDLVFSRREQVPARKLSDSIATLVSLGLVESYGNLHLTEDGFLTRAAPIGPRARAALAEAHRMGMIPELLPLIAMIDMKDVRHKFNERMYFITWKNSDLVAQTIAASYYLREQRKSNYKDLVNFAKNNNINSNKIREYNQLLTSLENLVRQHADFSMYLNAEGNADVSKKLDQITKRVLFRSYIDTICSDTGMGTETSPKLSEFTSSNTWMGSEDRFGLGGEIRRIEPRKKTFGSFPFYVLEHITVFTKEDFQKILSIYGRDMIMDRMVNHENSRRSVQMFYNETKLSEKSISKIVPSTSLSFSNNSADKLESHGDSALALALKQAGLV